MNRVVNQRYTILRTLGEGGMGEVFLAADRERPGALVALKYLARRSRAVGDPERLREEFLKMSRLSHPHLVQVHDLETDRERGEPFIAMEYVEGVDFLTACRGAPLPVVVDLAAQACLALEYLHAQGMAHCDLKPENLMVSPAASDRPARVRLLDFGLAGALEGKAWEARGSLPYAAPEQFRGEWVDHRADLYSLGVLLYQAVSGRLPFAADSAAALIQAHLTEEPLPPGQWRKEIDAGLEAIILRLLRKRPAERYQTARQVVEALRRLAAGPDLPRLAPLPHRAPRLVGHEGPQAALDTLIASLLAPDSPQRPLRLLLRGPAGSGKSRLAEEARTRARSRGIEVVQAGAGCGPAGPLDLILRLRAALAGARGRLQTGPVAPALDAAVDLDPAQSPLARGAQLWEAVLPMLEQSPLLILLEDLHAADADSLEALAGFLGRGEQARVGLVATSREPLAGLSVSLASEWEQADAGRTEELEPLSEVDISRLLASLLGAASETPAPAELLRRAGGNPRFAIEWALWLLERGLLEARDGALRLEPAAAGPLEAPPGLIDLARLRLQGLSAPGAALAQALAIFDRPVLRADAAAVADLAPAAAEAAAHELAERDLLASPADGEQSLALAHDALRDAARPSAADSLQLLYARAAARLEEGGSAPAAEVAFHWRQAGQPARMLAHALRAADEAAAAGAREQQVRLLEWALGAIPADRPAERIGLLHRMARTHMDVNAWGKARAVYLRLEEEARTAGDAGALLESLVGLHTCCAHLGDVEEARRIEPQVRLQLGIAPDPVKEARFVRTLAHLSAWEGSTDEAAALARRAAGLYQQAGLVVKAALCLNNLGSYLLGVRPPEDSDSLLRESESLLQASGDEKWLCLPRINLGVLARRKGSWAEAVERLEREVGELRRHGLGTWVPETLVELAVAREQAGQLDRALADYESAADLARRQARLQVRLYALDRHGTLLRRLGLHERAARVHGEALDTARRHQLGGQVAFLSAALAEDLCEAGDAARAAALAAEADSEAQRLHQPRARLRALLAASRAALAGGDSQEAAGFIAAARPLADPAHQHAECAWIETAAARACLELGDRPAAGAALARGREQARRGSLASEELELLALGLESGLSADPEEDARRLARGVEDLGGKISDPALARLARTAPAWRSAAEQALRLSGGEPTTDSALPERRALRALADIGRIVETLEDSRRLAASLLERARELVGAERALLVLTDADGSNPRAAAAADLPGEAEQEALEFSRQALARGLEAPLLVLDAAHDSRLAGSSSVERFGIRSVLCAPLRLRGTLLGAVYLDSRGHVLAAGQDHLRFVEAFAHQAAVALDACRALERLRGERERLRGRARERYRFHALLGRSAAMQQVYDLLEPFSKSDLPVLVTGESGTGKELVARALHWNGPRRDGPFVAENCAAIPENLLESELFGHLRGAFTGAERDRRGVFLEASGGTLLLDEVGEMGAALQAKLLRVLQEKEVRPLGGSRTVSVDARIVAATQRDLSAAVQAGRFREDLLYRLRVLTLRLPPLRERLEDLPLLARHFLEEHRREYGRAPADLAPEVIERLGRYAWPGNVRELRGEVQKMSLVAEGPRVEVRHLTSHPELFGGLLRPGRAPLRPRTGTLRDLERLQVERALRAARGDKQKAAALLGLSRATLYRKLRRYRIAAPSAT